MESTETTQQDPEHGWQLSSAYDPPRIVMQGKEEYFFVNLCYPTNSEMATLCNCIFLYILSPYTPDDGLSDVKHVPY